MSSSTRDRIVFGCSIILLVILSTVQGRTIQLDSFNPDVIIAAGEKLILRCASKYEVKTSWYKGDDLIDQPPTRIRILKQSLRFKYVRTSDSGNYACRLNAERTTEWRNVTVYVEDVQNDGYENDNEDLGSVLGARRPDEETNELDVALRNLPETRSLHLEIDPDNDKNENGKAGDHNKKAPASAPTINKTDEMHGTTVKPAGNMFRLRCPSTGNPTPNITWLKNNEEPKRAVGPIVMTKWTLRVEDLVVTDGGNYTCIVCNIHGCVNNTFKVEVIERFPHKPYINEGFPKNVTALINSTATFRCPIISDLEPFMQWVKVAEYPDDAEGPPNGTLLQVEE